jgi:hypothetical protein
VGDRIVIVEYMIHEDNRGYTIELIDDKGHNWFSPELNNPEMKRRKKALKALKPKPTERPGHYDPT